MKKLIPFLCVFVLYFTNCTGPKPGDEPVVAENPADKLQGVWKLKSVTMTTADTTTTSSEIENPSFKILSGSHWAFGYQENDSTIMAGGGTFTYDGETYTETIEYHAVSGVVGRTINFDLELEGNTWHHVGTITDGDQETTLDETWEKVE